MKFLRVTPRHGVSATGQVIVAATGRVLTPRLDSDGYQIVSLWYEGQYETAKVHCLVLTAWVGPRPSTGYEADHVNGKRADNRVANLRWLSRSENRRNLHSRRMARSGVRGVRQARASWQAYGRDDGCFVHIGQFATKRAAVTAKTEWEAERAAR
jgi:hypothetical protein